MNLLASLREEQFHIAEELMVLSTDPEITVEKLESISGRLDEINAKYDAELTRLEIFYGVKK